MQKLKQFFIKTKDFYKAHLLSSTIGVGTFLLFLSALWHPFMYVLLAYLFVSIAFFNVQEILCINFFFLPFSGFLILFVGLIAYSAVVVFVKYFIDLAKKRVEVYKLPLILTCIIVVLFSLIFYETTIYSIGQGFMIIAVLFYLYVIFSYRKKISAKICSIYFIVGLAISCVMGALLYVIPFAKMYVFQLSGGVESWTYGFLTIHERMFSGKRLLLLSFHINHLAVFCAYILAFVIYEYLKKTKHTLKENIVLVIGAVVSISVGMLTMSKAFLVIFVLMFLYTLVMAIIVYRKRAFKFILPVVIVCAIFGLIFRNQAVMIVNRFFSKTLNQSVISAITTGRSGIWYKFFAEMFGDARKIMFGVGLFTRDVVDIGPHSLYVAVVCRFGIVGTFMFFVLIWSYIKAAGKLKWTLNSLFPMVVLLTLFFQEAGIDERLYLLMLSFFLAFGENDNFKKQEALVAVSDDEVVEINNLDTTILNQPKNQIKSNEKTQSLNQPKAKSVSVTKREKSKNQTNKTKTSTKSTAKTKTK